MLRFSLAVDGELKDFRNAEYARDDEAGPAWCEINNGARELVLRGAELDGPHLVH